MRARSFLTKRGARPAARPGSLSLFSLEEERDRSRTRVRADDAADHVDKELPLAEALPDQPDEEVDVLLAVAVADKDGIVRTERGKFRHLVHERGRA